MKSAFATLAFVTLSLEARADVPPDTGPRREALADPTPRRDERPAVAVKYDASEPRKIVGIALTVMGIFDGVIGSCAALGFTLGSDGEPLATGVGLVIGVPFMTQGLIVSSIGISLWVSGAREVPRPDLDRNALLPNLMIGAGSAGASWRF